MILMAFMVHLFVVALFKFIPGESVQLPFMKYSTHYAELLSQEIGSPPDPVKAKEVSRIYNVQIRYEKDKKTWTTSNQLPGIKEVQQELRNHETGSHFPLQYSVVTNRDGIVKLDLYNCVVTVDHWLVIKSIGCPLARRRRKGLLGTDEDRYADTFIAVPDAL